MTELSSGADLRTQLDRWVAAGLIDAAQAVRIEAAEAARAGRARARVTPVPAAVPAAGQPPSTGSRAPLVAEALGYAGGVLAIAAGILMVREFWRGIPTVTELALAAVACVALGAAGATLHITGQPALRRLRSALWLMSLASLAAFMGVLADQVWKFSPVSSALVTAAAAVAYGAAAWGLAVIRGYLPPAATGYFAAGAGLLTGAQLTMQVAAGHALAIATVAGLLAAGVLLRRAWLVALGAVGVLLVVPQTATRYLPTSAAAPLAIFVVGVVLLGSAVWLAKRRAASR